MAFQAINRMLRYGCPACGQLHRISLVREHLHCVACGQAMRLTPGMFDRSRFIVGFVVGGIFVGMMLGRLRWALGGLPYGMDQLVLDLVCFWIYAWISRFVFFQFQTIEMDI